MSKRDLVSEILEKKSRHASSSGRWENVAVRIRDLIAGIDYLEMAYDRFEGNPFVPWRGDVELWKYLPIGMVACFEAYFRMVIRDLIDAGEPFRANAARFRDLKFGLDIAISIDKHSVTLGEFVAHILPISTIADINHAMTTIANVEFLPSLKQLYARMPRQLDLFQASDEDMVHRLIKNSIRLFELRHIFCHELAHGTESDPAEIRDCVGAGVEFLWTSEALVSNLIGSMEVPPYPARGHGSAWHPGEGTPPPTR